MAIYYKFKSARDYDTIAMDGPFISVGILKDKIFETKHLGSGKDLDIVVSNAQTNEEYLDEAMLIPKNTSVLIRRVPGRPRITVITAQEPRMENKVENVQADISNVPVSAQSAPKYPEDEWDEFGNDLYAIPDFQDAQHKNPCPDLAPKDEKVDEESKIQALIDTPALDWQQNGPDNFGAGRGYGRGMAGRMGGRGFGMERKTPPPGYTCHRCSIPGHFIQHCPTNGDPNYDVKRVKPPTGIPKSMLMATPDGSYSLPSGAVAVLKPNEDAFEKEMEGLPSTTRFAGELPPELKCPLCKQVMRDAALTSKCCFQSFCDKCIRDHIISKSRCVCGATDVLADDLLPNKTVRDTINRILEVGNNSADNAAGSMGHIPDLESARCPPPKVLSPTTSAASKGEKKPALSNNETSTVKLPMEIAEITSAPRESAEVKPVNACESTQGSVTVKETTDSKLTTQAPKEEVQQQGAAGEQEKKKKKKTRVPGADMQWNHEPDLAGPDYMMQMGQGPQYFNGMQPGFNGMQPGFNGMQPGFNGVQPGFNGFHPGFNGYPGLIPGAIPPFMGYGLNPMDLAFGGGMNMMHQDPYVAQQGFGFPNVPPPHRDLAELGNRMNTQRAAMMGRDEVEARKAEMLRKREMEKRTAAQGGNNKMFRDGEKSRMMMNKNGTSSSSMINPNKSRQAHPPPNPDYDRRRRLERLSPDHPPPRKINSPLRDFKRKSERYSDERDREKSRHQDLDREHNHRTRDRRDDDRSRDHRHNRDSERNQHHHRKRSEPLTSEPPAATKSEIDNSHKSSVFARISFPEEESSGKRRKVSSSSSTSVEDLPTVAVGTSIHRQSRKEIEVADYESSDEDRHFKRKPSRYERSPPVVITDVSDDKQRYSKRGKRERSRA